jgi:4,5-dihydroxyphthalate decarboxylase
MDELYARLLSSGDDPLPYGVEPNRGALEELVRHALSQGILTRPVEIESLFAPSTLSLEA